MTTGLIFLAIALLFSVYKLLWKNQPLTASVSGPRAPYYRKVCSTALAYVSQWAVAEKQKGEWQIDFTRIGENVVKIAEGCEKEGITFDPVLKIATISLVHSATLQTMTEDVYHAADYKAALGFLNTIRRDLY